MRQMVIGQPFRGRRRKQERLFRGVRPVRFRHARKRSQTAVGVDPICASGVPSEARSARCSMRNTLLADNQVRVSAKIGVVDEDGMEGNE
jgi:hypothetical protein